MCTGCAAISTIGSMKAQSLAMSMYSPSSRSASSGTASKSRLRNERRCCQTLPPRRSRGRSKQTGIEVPRYIDVESPPTAVADEPRKIFTDVSDDELLGYGVPVEWLNDVKAATEDSLLDLSGHLPAEASEGLLELATGGPPIQPVVEVFRETAPLQSAQIQRSAKPVAPDRQAPTTGHEDPFAHPDAQRRFRVMANPDPSPSEPCTSRRASSSGL